MASLLTLVLVGAPARANGPQDVPPPPPVDSPLRLPRLDPALEDVILTGDGVTHRGRILAELQNGFLFRDNAGHTVVVPFTDVADLDRANARPVAAPPPAPPLPQPAPTPVTAMVYRSRMELVDELQSTAVYRNRTRSEGVAYLLELLLPGVGHMYAGSWVEGITHMVVVAAIPTFLATSLAVTVGLMYALGPEDRLSQVGLAMVVNLGIILAAALVSARVSSVMRAGPAAAAHNQRVMSDLVRQAREHPVPVTLAAPPPLAPPTIDDDEGIPVPLGSSLAAPD